MKNFQNTPVVLFSIWPENGAALMALVGDYPIRQIEGCYKGQTECAFLMQAENFYKLGIPALLWADHQESVLYLDNQRGAWLLYGPGYEPEQRDRQYLGAFREVGQAVATKRDAYTKVGDRYFVAG